MALALSNYGSISWGCPKSYAPGSFEVTWGHVEEGISHRGTGQHPAVPGSSRQHQLLLFLWTSSLLIRFWILKLETTCHQTHSGHRWLALRVKGASGLNSLWFTFSFYSRKPSHLLPLSIVRWVTVECTAVNPGQTLYPPFCDSHSWGKEEDHFQKDSVIVGENLKLEAIPGSEPRFCTFYISDLDTLLHLSEPYFTEFVHWWWSPFLCRVVLKTGQDTLNQVPCVLPDTCRCSARCHRYLIVDTWIWVSKRCRGSSGWASQSVIVLQPRCVGHPDCPVPQEWGQGKALLS